jgi:hypothetical protein
MKYKKCNPITGTAICASNQYDSFIIKTTNCKNIELNAENNEMCSYSYTHNLFDPSKNSPPNEFLNKLYIRAGCGNSLRSFYKTCESK